MPELRPARENARLEIGPRCAELMGRAGRSMNASKAKNLRWPRLGAEAGSRAAHARRHLTAHVRRVPRRAVHFAESRKRDENSHFRLFFERSRGAVEGI